MSQEAVRKFQEAIQNRDDLKKKLKEVKTKEAFVWLAAGEGYVFTAQELDGPLSDLKSGVLPLKKADSLREKKKEPLWKQKW